MSTMVLLFDEGKVQLQTFLLLCTFKQENNSCETCFLGDISHFQNINN
jgi:hypothetical protein